MGHPIDSGAPCFWNILIYSFLDAQRLGVYTCRITMSRLHQLTTTFCPLTI